LVSDLLSAGGAVQIADDRELGTAFDNLLRDERKRETVASKGIAALAAHRGATERTADLIEKVVAKG